MTLLDPQPSGNAVAWLRSVDAAAEAALPSSFTVTLDWPETDGLALCFTLTPSVIEPEEWQYRLLHEVQARSLRDETEVKIPANTLAFSGFWLNRARVPKHLTSRDLDADFGDRLVNAVHEDARANRAILLLELTRVARLRLRVGETAIAHGSHDGDVAALQAALAAADAG